MRQLVRYAVVGIATNLAGYAVYLLVTWTGVEPKLAMTCLYAVGATASFLGNRSWTFGHRGNVAAGAARFALAQLAGYLINLALLVVFSDHLGFPHQAVQGAAIIVVALFLFAAFRLFVFPAAGRRAGT